MSDDRSCADGCEPQRARHAATRGRAWVRSWSIVIDRDGGPVTALW